MLNHHPKAANKIHGNVLEVNQQLVHSWTGKLAGLDMLALVNMEKQAKGMPQRVHVTSVTNLESMDIK